MNKQTLELVVLYGPARMDAMMHAADVFEPWKSLVTDTVRISCTWDSDKASLARVISRFKEGYEIQGYRVTAIFSPGNPEGAWRDPEIKAVSTGHDWMMLNDRLKQLGYIEKEGPVHESQEQGSDSSPQEAAACDRTTESSCVPVLRAPAPRNNKSSRRRLGVSRTQPRSKGKVT